MRRAITCAVGLLLLVSCTAAGTSPGPGSTPPATGATVLVTPSVALTAQPSPAATAVPAATPPLATAVPPGPLAPGTHTTGIVRPTITFTVPAGFTYEREYTDQMAVRKGAGQDADALSVSRVATPGTIAALKQVGMLTVTSLKATTIGGSTCQAALVVGGPKASQATILNGADSDWSLVLEDNATMRIYECALGRDTIVVEYDAPTAAWAAYAPIGANVVASIRFGG